MRRPLRYGDKTTLIINSLLSCLARKAINQSAKVGYITNYVQNIAANLTELLSTVQYTEIQIKFAAASLFVIALGR